MRIAAPGSTACAPPPRTPAFTRYHRREALFAPGISQQALAPNRLRWGPLDLEDADWLDSLTTMVVAGDGPKSQAGVAMHIYRCAKDMVDRAFVSADGELLILPEMGALTLFTELGRIDVKPGEIALIPRGVRFRVALPDGKARGYVAENHGVPFRLPDLGPIGANGLANPRDFETPVAWFEDREGDFELVQKFLGNRSGRPTWAARRWTSSRWHGNYAPCEIRSRPLQHDRHGQLRPSRSVDLHRAHLAQRRARHRAMSIS